MKNLNSATNSSTRTPLLTLQVVPTRKPNRILSCDLTSLCFHTTNKPTLLLLSDRQISPSFNPGLLAVCCAAVICRVCARVRSSRAAESLRRAGRAGHVIFFRVRWQGRRRRNQTRGQADSGHGTRPGVRRSDITASHLSACGARTLTTPRILGRRGGLCFFPHSWADTHTHTHASASD